MIYKISPNPSFPKRGKTLLKRGREKAEMTHSIIRRAGKNRDAGITSIKTLEE